MADVYRSHSSAKRATRDVNSLADLSTPVAALLGAAKVHSDSEAATVVSNNKAIGFQDCLCTTEVSVHRSMA